MRARVAAGWQALANRYQQPVLRRSLWQVANSFVPFCASWYLTYRSLAGPYGITLLLALLPAGFLVRIFAIQHDCGHGSFFRRRWWNDALGVLCSFLTLTPYHEWRRHHTLHHSTSGDLDRRGHGDVSTLTVREYLGRSRRDRLLYRLYRHPLVLFGVGTWLMFLLLRRAPSYTPRSWRRERRWVYLTDVAIAGLVAAMVYGVGPAPLVRVHLPIVLYAATVGGWLFFIHHQFEGTYWERHGSWDYVQAALRGSSYYKLPAVLQWFTGNIGVHHVHHLWPRVPNYALQRCHDENSFFHQVPVLTLTAALRAVPLALWDEERRRLVSFAEVGHGDLAALPGADQERQVVS